MADKKKKKKPLIGALPAAPTFAQVVATTTQAKLCDPKTSRRKVTVINHLAVAAFIGLTGVLSTTGVMLPATIGAKLEFTTTASLYIITAASTTTVGIYEEF